MIKVYQTSDSTATGDTTKTLIDTLTVPQGVSKLVGIAVVWGGAGVTTLEGVSGILTLESDTMDWRNLAIPMEPSVPLGTGLTCTPATKVWPCDVAVVPGATIKGSVTMDMAQTINPTARFVLAYA